jgi:hypothetical protein
MKIKRKDLITQTQALKILGFSDIRQVKRLIFKGKLKAYRLPMYDTKRFVSIKEVKGLIKPEEY